MFKVASSRATRQLAPQIRHTVRSIGGSHRNASSQAAFDWKDPLGSNHMFTEDELAIAETAESYCQERLLPRVLGMQG